MPRTIRMLALSGAVIAMLALPAAAGAAQVSPSSLDFGSVPVGTTSPSQTVTLTADCTTIFPAPPLCLSGATDLINVSPGTTGEFAVTTTCPAGLGPLPDGTSQSCPLDVTFTPTGGGLQTGILSTGTTGIGGLTPGPTVNLTGSGVAGTTSSGGPGTTTPRRKCKKHRKHHHNALAAKKRKCKNRKK